MPGWYHWKSAATVLTIQGFELSPYQNDRSRHADNEQRTKKRNHLHFQHADWWRGDPEVLHYGEVHFVGIHDQRLDCSLRSVDKTINQISLESDKPSVKQAAL
jgi:hypothetical protein